jgi:hypothetical protein
MAALALDRAPPLSLPLRFLRIAPCWGMVAGLLLLQGERVLTSRWAPDTVVLAHLFTLGIFGNAMLGSLLQFMPVVAGLRPRIGNRLGMALTVGFNLGIVGLACGMLRWPALLAPAGLTLVMTLGVYSICALASRRSDGAQPWLRTGLLLALSALLLTAGLGVVLTLALSGWVGVPLARTTDVHATLGLVGVALMLTGTVGSVVVPMFQGTVVPHRSILPAWIALLVTSLLACVLLRLAERSDVAGAVLALPVVAFALALLLLQWHAPHRRNPTLVGFWRLGAVALLAATAVWLLGLGWPDSRAAMLAGVLAIAVALPALVLGMLLEIVTFLAWIQLQGARPRGRRVPSVDVLLPESNKVRVLVAHAAAAIALVGAASWPTPWTVRIAGMALVLAYGLTCIELQLVERRSRGWQRRIDGNSPAASTSADERIPDVA